MSVANNGVKDLYTRTFGLRYDTEILRCTSFRSG